MRRPVMFSVGQVIGLFVQVAVIAIVSWILAFGAPWDEPACPVAVERPSSVVGGMGMPGRNGSSGGTP